MLPALVWLPAALAASGTSAPASRSRRHQAPPPPAPPDAFAFDEDVLELLSRMSLKQKVGQMTQIDVTMLVSFTGDCGSFHWEDPSSCQPVLNRDRLEAWLRDYHVGSILNSPYGTGCIRDKCGWDVREWRAFVR